VKASLMSYKSPDGQVRQELKSDINFARNFADALLLPYGVRHMVYLDVDTIVQGDLVELMDGLSFTDSRWFAASPNCAHRMESWYDFKSVVVRRTMRRRHCYINAGVYAVDLTRYALAGIQERIVQLVASHMRRQIWMQVGGDLPSWRPRHIDCTSKQTYPSSLYGNKWLAVCF
jgi:lipopolysaccharide biosynthesis glycosyltransferase